MNLATVVKLMQYLQLYLLQYNITQNTV